MKKILALLLVFGLIFGLAACGGEKGGSNDPQQGSSGQSEPAPQPAGSRMIALYENCIEDGDYGMGIEFMEGETSGQMYTAVKGDWTYVRMEAEGDVMVFLENDDGLFMISPNEKQALSLGEATDESPTEESDMLEDFDKDEEFTTGEMEVDGQKYYYEEFTDKDEEGNEYAVRYLFDGEDLKYMISYDEEDPVTVKVVSFDKEADASLFTIPGDYEIVSW